MQEKHEPPKVTMTFTFAPGQEEAFQEALQKMTFSFQGKKPMTLGEILALDKKKEEEAIREWKERNKEWKEQQEKARECARNMILPRSVLCKQDVKQHQNADNKDRNELTESSMITLHDGCNSEEKETPTPPFGSVETSGE